MAAGWTTKQAVHWRSNTLRSQLQRSQSGHEADSQRAQARAEEVKSSPQCAQV